MKVETPQILWHAEEKNLPAALLSLDVQGDILATAGQGIHIWRLNHQPQANYNNDAANNNGQKNSAPAVTNPKSSNSSAVAAAAAAAAAAIPPAPPAPPAPLPRAAFITALKCHDRPVNRIAFHARYLASAGDAGDIVIFYPVGRRVGWADVRHENDVRYTNAGRSGEAVTDLCWSGDGRRLVVGTIDHGVVVVERQEASSRTDHHTAAAGGGDDPNVSFRIVFRCHHWHAHYVQGVAYDPLNLYICTASSDRTVKVAVARTVKKQFQLLAPPASSSSSTTAFGGGGNKTGARPVHGGRFVDEGSLKSFCRRLAWTPDGGYLIVPAAHHENVDDETNANANTYATLLYARHRFDEPARILGGLDKPSICVRPNPVLFQVPDDCKENGQVPHRCIFAVLTWDSIILYDTYHDQPLSIITGIHYSNLVDAAWTADGRHLCVCSTDGFVTFVDFAEGELGRVYVPPPTTTPTAAATVVKSPQQQQCQEPRATDEDDESSCQLANLKIHSSSNSTVPMTTTTSATTNTTLPPCEAGWTAVQAPPTKRAKLETSKRGAVVENLDEANGIPKKKQKKRIQPILLAGTSTTTASSATSAAATSTTTGS